MFSLVRSLALAVTLAPAYAHLGATPPPHGFPEILHYRLSTTSLRAGQTASGEVETSENVIIVEAHVNYRSAPLKQVAPGKFALTYTVPWWLPPWLRHGYTLELVARSIDGVETSVEIPITIH